MADQTLGCPSCGALISVLRASPRSNAHVVAAYPCGCWVTPDDARRLAREHRERTGREPAEQEKN